MFEYFANPRACTCFVFIVPLFTWGQRVDEANCVEKYGNDKREECQARVKHRVLPGVYRADSLLARLVRNGLPGAEHGIRSGGRAIATISRCRSRESHQPT